MYIRLNVNEDATPIGDIDIDYTQILAELGGFHRYTAEAHTFDGLAGLRYSTVKGDLSLGPLPNIDESVDWTDPFLGARWNWRMTEKWGLRLRGDVGGFGVGSDTTWNVNGMIAFKPWKNVAIAGGYRVLYQDYSKGSGRNIFSYDATM